MSDSQNTDESEKNTVLPAQPKGGRRRRLLLDTAKIGATVPVVMTISNRAFAGGGAKSANGGKLSAGNSHTRKH